jgi:hypothetical protein
VRGAFPRPPGTADYVQKATGTEDFCSLFRRGELGAAGRAAAGAEAGGDEEAQAVENLINIHSFLLLSTLPFSVPHHVQITKYHTVVTGTVHVPLLFKFRDVDNRMTNVYMFIVLINYNEAYKLLSE